MLKICFFSRLELTNLYGRIHHHLASNFNIIHLAYSNKETTLLKSKYGIPNVINFKDEIKLVIKNTFINEDTLKLIDEMFIKQSKGRFSLNAAIRFDRSFRFLDYETCLLLSQVYYQFWNEFLSKHEIDIILHEPPAVFMTHVAANLCKEKGILYLSQSQVAGLHKYNWIFIEGDNGHPVEWGLNNLEILDNGKKTTAVNFVENYRKDFNTFFEVLESNKSYNHGNGYFLKQTLKITFKTIIGFLRRNKDNEKNKDILNHLENYQNKLKHPYLRQLNNLWYKAFWFKYDDFNQNENYFYYPLHAEPEAAVLYRGDGIYEGQVKLIENIAEQLPPGVNLYIKDHPHRSAFTDMIYFERLKRIPNLKIIDPFFSGKVITFYSKGIITISGTTGFEAILFNKPVVLLGQSFYMNSNRVIQVKNIRELRDVIYSIEKIQFTDDFEFFSFISTFLDSTRQGFIAYFPSHVKKVNINHEENCKIVADDMKYSFNQLANLMKKND